MTCEHVVTSWTLNDKLLASGADVVRYTKHHVLDVLGT